MGNPVRPANREKERDMKIRLISLCAVVVISLVMLCCAPSGAQPPERATNVILLIGDGMGPEIVGLATEYSRVIDGRELWLERAISEGHLALANVRPVDALVADSAAAATALATGRKTANDMVSVDPRGKPLTTILELAEKSSKSTGLVTTTRLTHATPACFAAHVAHRDSENDIAVQMLAAGVDVMLGGGLRNWIPENAATSEYSTFTGTSKRQDSRNLVEEARQAGYSIVTGRDELAGAHGANKLLGLFAASYMPYALDRRPDDETGIPSLPEMTEAALDILSRNKEGFFLMVEGGRIDHAAHANDVASMLVEMMEFDEAIGVAYAFAQRHPGTMLLITADHATGASCLSARYSDDAGDTIYPTEENLKKIARQDASFEGILTPLMTGPSLERLKALVLEHTGIGISDEDAAFIMKMEPVSPFHVIKPEYRALGGYATLALGRVLGPEFGTSWGTAEHFAASVVVVGYGARADLVRGYIDNTEVFTIMKTAGGL